MAFYVIRMNHFYFSLNIGLFTYQFKVIKSLMFAMNLHVVNLNISFPRRREIADLTFEISMLFMDTFDMLVQI